MNNRKKFTIWSTYALVALAVLYAVVGFTTGGKSTGQILALTVTLGIFSWLLSETLETYLEHHRNDNWRQYSSVVLGAFLLGVEVHLVHFGMGWMFDELGTFALYAASAGFSFMTLFAKATYGYSYEETEVVEEVSQEREIIKAHPDTFGMEQFIQKVEDVVGKQAA